MVTAQMVTAPYLSPSVVLNFMAVLLAPVIEQGCAFLSNQIWRLYLG
jgi:hypothetical protein